MQKGFICLFASQRSRVRSPSSPPKMEIAVVKTTAISRLTTEIPQIGFDFDHLKGTPFRKEYPSFVSCGAGLAVRRKGAAAGQQKVGAGFCPQKGVWQPLAASQMLCLPHPRVGKIVSPPLSVSIRTAGRCGTVSPAYFSLPTLQSNMSPRWSMPAQISGESEPLFFV